MFRKLHKHMNIVFAIVSLVAPSHCIVVIMSGTYSVTHAAKVYLMVSPITSPVFEALYCIINSIGG